MCCKMPGIFDAASWAASRARLSSFRPRTTARAIPQRSRPCARGHLSSLSPSRKRSRPSTHFRKISARSKVRGGSERLHLKCLHCALPGSTGDPDEATFQAPSQALSRVSGIRSGPARGCHVQRQGRTLRHYPRGLWRNVASSGSHRERAWQALLGRVAYGLSGISSWQRLHPHGGRGRGGLPHRPSPSPPTGDADAADRRRLV